MNQTQKPPPLEVEEMLSILDGSQLPNGSYIDQWRELNIPVYPWSLVAGKTKPRERMIPVSKLQWIVDATEATYESTGVYSALRFVLHNLKKHIDPGSQ